MTSSNNSYNKRDILENISGQLRGLVLVVKKIREKIDLRRTRKELESLSKDYEK